MGTEREETGSSRSSKTCGLPSTKCMHAQHAERKEGIVRGFPLRKRTVKRKGRANGGRCIIISRITGTTATKKARRWVALGGGN